MFRNLQYLGLKFGKISCSQFRIEIHIDRIEILNSSEHNIQHYVVFVKKIYKRSQKKGEKRDLIHILKHFLGNLVFDKYVRNF